MTFALEQRVAALEKRIADLETRTNAPAKDAWRQTVGMFTDNPGMQELFADAMKIRQADREKATRRAKS